MGCAVDRLVGTAVAKPNDGTMEDLAMNDRTHLLVLTMPDPGTRRDDVLDVLRWVLSDIQAFPGRLESYLSYESCDAYTIHLVTGWRSLPALERFVRSKQFGSLLATTELLDAPSTIRTGVIEPLDLKRVGALRGPADATARSGR